MLLWLEVVDTFLFVGAVLVYFFWKKDVNKGSVPPGPWKLPVIGNLHQIALTRKRLPHEAFDTLSKKYGPLMSLKMGMKEAVIISSYEEMAELLTKDECSGRDLDEFIAERCFGKEIGLVFGNGEGWKTIRRFTISTLRESGFGKKQGMESAMQEELQDLLQELKTHIENNSGKVHVDHFFAFSLLNVLWSMVAGRKFSRDDEKLKRLLDLHSRGVKAGTFGSDIAIAFPILRHLFPGLTGANTFKELFNEMHQYLREMLEEYRERGNYLQDPDCFVDFFLLQMETEAETEDDPTIRCFTEEQFITVMIDLFQIGSETVNGSLSYAILFMILNPDVQEKVQEELDRIVPDGKITLSHKSQLVYTEATILETLRLGDIIPLIPPRKVTKGFSYKGYDFKQGMVLIPNLYSVMSSEVYWGDPKVFRPERFIGADGKLCNTEKMAPFGFGKRFCFGETLATSSMFLFFATLLKTFTFKRIPTEPEPTTVPLPSFTLNPQPFNMLVQIRK